MPVNRVLIKDQAYQRLLQAIVDGELRPGEILKTDELVEALGVSRAPIKDALARLESEQLVEMVPNRYTRVAPVDEDNVNQALLTQMLFFRLALAEAIGHLDSDQLEQLDQIHDAAVATDNGARFRTLVGDYIRLLAESAGNEFLAECVAQCGPLVNRAMSLPETVITPSRIREYFDTTHAAVLDGDREAAVDAVTEFSAGAREQFLRSDRDPLVSDG